MTRYDWYQNDNQVIVTVYEKNIREQDVDLKILEKNFELNVKLSNNSEFQLEFTLFSDVSAHKVSVFATKVEIYLEKKTRGLKWLSLEHKELTSAPVSYPSSSKNPKNWDSIEKDIKKEESQTVPKGDEAVNELFRKIYANAPEETRRAMNKSFQESGGTCLSTNWEEVKKETVKISPPEGVEAKKFEL